jgi:hypothetical protein
MSTRSQIVATARAEIGTGETPPGSNRNKYVTWYGWGPGAWCAMFTAWVWSRNGVSVKDVFTASWAATTQGADAAKRKGLWRTNLRDAQPGDVVFYKLDGGDPGYVNHTGIVVSVTGSTVTSIEGNTQNVVAERVRPIYAAVGYIDMSRYVQAPPVPQPPAAPRFPGVEYFADGQHNGYVTMLGQRLVLKGFGGAYKVGPGPDWGEADRANTEAFQRAQGWTGSDADGYPGPETWRRLFS